MAQTRRKAAWWHLPPGDEALARTRWAFGLVALFSLILNLGALLRSTHHPVPIVGLVLVLAANCLLGYRIRRVPLLMDLVDVGALLAVMVLLEDVLGIFSVAFQILWYRSLFTSSWRTWLRGGLYVGMFWAGGLFALIRPGQSDHGALVGGVLIGGVFSSLFVTFSAWQLALALTGRELSQQRERLVSETGTILITASDADRIDAIGRAALQRLAELTPGLRAVLLTPVVNGAPHSFAADPITGPFADLPTVIDVPPSTAPDSPELLAILDRATGRPYKWTTTAYPGLASGRTVALGGPRRLPRDVVSAASSIFNQMTLALQNSEAHRQLSIQALTDGLTGLANRQGFTEETGRLLAARGTVEISVMFIDLDDFKDVNDNLGHAAGDDLLIQVAETLRSLVRADDVVARLGGDEFAVLLRNPDREVAEQVADRIVFGISVLHADPDGRFAIGASVGIVTADPGADLQTLLVQADVAMYAAKSLGKGRVQKYRPDLLPTSSRGRGAP